MNTSNVVQHIPARPKKPLPAVLAEVEARRADLIQLLPEDISFETFMSHIKVAVMKTPGLLECTPASVVLAVVQAANDGLLCDGREAAIVVYNAKQRDGSWRKTAQYQQMYLGILKRIRQASEVAKIEAFAVYDRDTFDYALGDDAFITHKPYFGTEDKGPVIGAYAMVTFKDGVRQFDVMDARSILAIRERSKGFNPDKPQGPWHTDFAEMSKKTILKRLGKILPQARGRAVLSGDADDSGADEEVEHYPELGVPEDRDAAHAHHEPDAPASIEPTSRTIEPNPSLQEQASETEGQNEGQNPDPVLTSPNPSLAEAANEKEESAATANQQTSEEDEVKFWKDKLRMLRSWQSHAQNLVESEERYNEWSAQFEEIPAEVEVEVAKIVKRRVDQLRGEAARKEPSEYQKMQDGQ